MPQDGGCTLDHRNFEQYSVRQMNLMEMGLNKHLEKIEACEGWVKIPAASSAVGPLRFAWPKLAFSF